MQFIEMEGRSPHGTRRKQILERYPQVTELIGPNPWSALLIALYLSIQFTLALGIQDWPWYGIAAMAYAVGAIFNHGLYVLIHEAGHNLVFKAKTANKWVAILCDLAIGFPGAMAFRKYHMMHHRNLGDEAMDPDVPPKWEASLVGGSSWRKALWITFFMLSQAFRPSKIKGHSLWDRWIVINFAVCIFGHGALIMAFGPGYLPYLLLSTFFGLGLHPCGGRWIQEHFVTREGQETYNYMGPLNWPCFNIGLHNEHHDLMNVPWNRLPKLRKMAWEFYRDQKTYSSYTGLIWRFITDPKLTAFSRIVWKAKSSPEDSDLPGSIQESKEFSTTSDAYSL